MGANAMLAGTAWIFSLSALQKLINGTLQNKKQQKTTKNNLTVRVCAAVCDVGWFEPHVILPPARVRGLSSW